MVMGRNLMEILMPMKSPLIHDIHASRMINYQETSSSHFVDES